MEIIMWSKTLISVYPRLDKVIKALDKSIDKVISGSSHSIGNAMGEIGKVRELLHQKKGLQLAKLAVKTVMGRISACDVLIARYIYHATFRQIAEGKNTYIRAAFRQNQSQLNEMGMLLVELGYDSNVCDELWGDNPIFRQVINELSHGKDSDSEKKCYMIYNFAEETSVPDKEERYNSYNPYIAMFV